MTNPEIEHILDGVEGQALAKTRHTWPFRDLRLLAAEVRRLEAEVQRLKDGNRVNLEDDSATRTASR